jgi:hypothetical protein
MATTTTNYGFDIPQSTDLVKDGATAIATLGQDIDTAMNTALGTKKAGMVLLNTTSFSGVASQSINNVFSSTYDNYRVIYTPVASNTVSSHFLRLRASGTDDSSANYQRQFLGVDNTSVTGARGTNGSSFLLGDLIGTDRDAIALDFYSPNLARNTAIWKTQLRRYGTTSTLLAFHSFGHTSTTQFDGFTIAVTGAGITISGEISVYGYNK